MNGIQKMPGCIVKFDVCVYPFESSCSKWVVHLNVKGMKKTVFLNALDYIEDFNLSHGSSSDDEIFRKTTIGAAPHPFKWRNDIHERAINDFEPITEEGCIHIVSPFWPSFHPVLNIESTM